MSGRGLSGQWVGWDVGVAMMGQRDGHVLCLHCGSVSILVVILYYCFLMPLCNRSVIGGKSVRCMRFLPTVSYNDMGIFNYLK